MAGILDFLQSPDAQLGIGLLAAGGPTTDPNRTGLGQRIAGALQGVTANQAAMTDAQLKKAQLADELQKTQVNAFQLKRLQDWQNMVTGGSTPGAATGSSPTGASPSMTAQASGVVPPAMGAGVSPGMGAPPQGAPGMPPQQAPGFAYAIPGVGDQQSRAIAAILPPADYMKIYADKAGPQTDIAKMMVDAGIDRNSPLGRQLVQAAIAKANNVPPVSVRPGGYTLDNLTGVATQYPHVPDGSQAVSDGQGGWRIVPVQGGLQGMQAGANATALGKAGAVPTVRYQGNTPLFSTQANDVAMANGANPQAASVGTPSAPGYANEGQMRATVQGGMGADPKAAMREIAATQQQLAANPNLDPQSKAMLQGHIADMQRQLSNITPTQTAGQSAPGAQITPVLPPGADKGAVLSQEELSKTGQELSAANAAAPTVISRLQNIKLLAPGAITGAESSRRDFYNGLLSLAGIKGTEDAKTASDLVDKNSAQIVSSLRMGQGAAGTDALQTLLGAGNPSRHMTVEAMNDAVDQLIASQKMNQARSQILMPHVIGRDPVALQQKQLAFDSAADPRVFQLNSMNPQQQAAYVKKLAPQDAQDLLGKVKTLKEMGAL